MVTEPTFALEYTENDPFYKAADDGNPYADLDMMQNYSEEDVDRELERFEKDRIERNVHVKYTI